MAGAQLAARGYSVAMFDPHYVAGGCATQFSRMGVGGAYRFDIGIHYVGDCGEEGPIPRMLAEVGVRQRFAELDPQGFDNLVFPDFTFRVPACLDTYRDRLVDHFGARARPGIDRYVRFVRDVGSISDAVTRHGPAHVRTGLAAIRRGLGVARFANATMEEFFVENGIHDLRLRAVLLGQHGDYALPPSKVSAIVHCAMAAHFFRGAYYPIGGGQIMSDALADVIEARGGSIHLRRGVAEILVEGGRAVGVRTEARRGHAAVAVRARAVVSNADPTHTLDDLLAGVPLPRAWRRRAARFEMAGALFMLFLGLRGDLADDGMAAANYWVFDGYDTESAYRRLVDPSADPHLSFITSASVKDPTTSGHAPAGMSNVEVMSLVDGDPRGWGVSPEQVASWRYKRDPRYGERKRRMEDALIARLDALFPGTADRIVFRESATPLSQTRYTRALRGTAYGLAATPRQLWDRPDYTGPVPGLFLCGASTRAGHGILGAMMSGKLCARAVDRMLRTRRWLRPLREVTEWAS